MKLNAWIERVAAGFGYNLSKAQAYVYLAELESWKLSDAEWERLERNVRHNCERFPTIKQLTEEAKAITLPKVASNEPNWKTWKDPTGRTYSERTPGYRATIPSDRDLEQWKREACSREEGRKAFAEGFLAAGGDPAKLQDYMRALAIPAEELEQVAGELPEPEEQEIPF